MIYKGKWIKAGDVLWNAAGRKFVVDNWSVEADIIYVRDFSGVMSISSVEPLYWNYPFISKRRTHEQT